uniref:Uncharacterized protein n=1 Tax=Methylophaga nitratireducenticrescens TaxID=754476 RepID=I1XLM2_METNJ
MDIKVNHGDTETKKPRLNSCHRSVSWVEPVKPNITHSSAPELIKINLALLIGRRASQLSF